MLPRPPNTYGGTNYGGGNTGNNPGNPNAPGYYGGGGVTYGGGGTPGGGGGTGGPGNVGGGGGTPGGGGGTGGPGNVGGGGSPGVGGRGRPGVGGGGNTYGGGGGGNYSGGGGGVGGVRPPAPSYDPTYLFGNSSDWQTFINNQVSNSSGRIRDEILQIESDAQSTWDLVDGVRKDVHVGADEILKRLKQAETKLKILRDILEGPGEQRAIEQIDKTLKDIKTFKKILETTKDATEAELLSKEFGAIIERELAEVYKEHLEKQAEKHIKEIIEGIFDPAPEKVGRGPLGYVLGEIIDKTIGGLIDSMNPSADVLAQQDPEALKQNDLLRRLQRSAEFMREQGHEGPNN